VDDISGHAELADVTDPVDAVERRAATVTIIWWEMVRG